MHTVLITDANGCALSGSATIGQPVAVTNVVTEKDVNCNGGTNGSVTATFGGGTGPYTASLDGGMAAAATSPATFAGLGAGMHIVLITDANGCALSGSATIGHPSAVMLGLTQLACSSGSNGSIRATFSGGTGSGYQCSIDGSLFSPCSSPQTFSGLTAASHTVIVEDGNHCPQQATLIVSSCGTCVTTSSIGSNFNGTSISPSNYIWFNANFSASGIQNGTTISLTSSTISIANGG